MTRVDQSDTGSGAAGRLASLDGVRAVAIALVVLWHVARAPEVSGWLPLRTFGDGAALGVRVFFVLSGFLITTLILREEAATGGFSLRAFYARRARRILPAFVVFLLGVAALAWAGLAFPSAADMWHAVTLTMNFHPHRDWSVGHLWSLSVEEQFYLLWPACMLFVKRRRIHALLAVVAIAPVCRVGMWALGPAQEVLIGEAFQTVMDAVATGCLLACLRDRLESTPRYMWWLESPLVWSLIPVILLCTRLHWFVSLAVGETATNVAIALLIHRVIVRPGDAVGRLLNARPVTDVGRMSYSLYLWQQPLLTGVGPLSALALVVRLGLIAGLAWLSFWFVERPFRTGVGTGPVRRAGPSSAPAPSAAAFDHAVVSRSKRP